MQKIGLFFGTFDPIHNGHLQLATYFSEQTDLNEIWFVITPQNPFKQDTKSLPNEERLALVKKALENHSNLKISTVEFDLPQPNYTIHTLAKLKNQYPQHTFVLLLGADNMIAFDRWKDYDQILSQFEVYVYPRTTVDIIPENFQNHANIRWTEAPKIELSSSQIRTGIREGKDVCHLLPKTCWNYLIENKLYGK